MSDQRKNAFTLIEALVVVAVIGLIASLLLPALAQAKASAKRIHCVSNIRQLGLAAMAYWDDNEQVAFPYFVGRDLHGATYWFGWLASGAEGTRRLDNRQGPLGPYIGSSSGSVELCPEFDYHHPLYKPKANGASAGFGYNLHLSPNGAAPPGESVTARRISQIKNPSALALFADAAQINDFQSPAAPDNPLIEEFYYISDGGSSYANGHFRHSNRANSAFIDGHVESVERAPGTKDLRLPQANIARLPQHHLIPQY